MNELNDPWKQAEQEALQRLKDENPDCTVTLGRYGEAIVTPIVRSHQLMAARALLGSELAHNNI